MNTKRPGVNTKNKRGPIQRQMDRTKLAEMMYAHPDWDDTRLTEEMAKVTGTALSRQQVNSDKRKMLENFNDREHNAIALARAAALEKLDKLEEMAYEGWSRSLKPNQTARAKQLAGRRKDKEGRSLPGDGDLYLAELETLTTEGVGDPRFLSTMLDIQKERNKIQAVYPNPKLEVQQTDVILVKAIASFDHRLWERPYNPDNVIDGEASYTVNPT